MGTVYWNEQRNGVWKMILHDLRHAFGSRLAQAGVSIIAIKDLMGHSSFSVTMRYAHLAPSSLRDAIRALERRGIRGKPELKSSHANTSRKTDLLGTLGLSLG